MDFKDLDHKNQTIQSKPFIKQITSPFIHSIIRVNNRLLEKNLSNTDASLMIKCCAKVPQIKNLQNEKNCIQSCKWSLILVSVIGIVLNSFNLIHLI